MKKLVLIVITILVLSIPMTANAEIEYVSKEIAIERMVSLYAEYEIHWQNIDATNYIPLTEAEFSDLLASMRAEMDDLESKVNQNVTLDFVKSQEVAQNTNAVSGWTTVYKGLSNSESVNVTGNIYASIGYQSIATVKFDPDRYGPAGYGGNMYYESVGNPAAVYAYSGPGNFKVTMVTSATSINSNGTFATIICSIQWEAKTSSGGMDFTSGGTKGFFDDFYVE